MSLPERGAWLRGVMAGRWADVEPALSRWRDSVVAALLALGEPTVVFTHYVAINVAVGRALGDDRVVVFAPDHWSVTVLEIASGALRLVERGAEAETQVR